MMGTDIDVRDDCIVFSPLFFQDLFFRGSQRFGFGSIRRFAVRNVTVGSVTVHSGISTLHPSVV